MKAAIGVVCVIIATIAAIFGASQIFRNEYQGTAQPSAQYVELCVETALISIYECYGEPGAEKCGHYQRPVCTKKMFWPNYERKVKS